MDEEKTVRPEDLERARKFIESAVWQVAKTMPECPHSYAQRKKCPDDNEFLWFAQAIKDNGVEEPYYKSMQTYWYIDGFRYWHGWKPIATLMWINRAEGEAPAEATGKT